MLSDESSEFAGLIRDQQSYSLCLSVYNFCVKLTNLMPDGVTEADVYDVDNNLSVNLFCTLTTLT